MLTTGAGSLAHQARIVRVLATTSFKLRHADSVLGYFWSLARPFALFLVLYFVFGKALRLGATNENYPIFLLVGIVLFTFFADATSRTMTSIVEQSPLLRKLSFPRVIIPVSASLTALFTFAFSIAAIGVFVAWARIVPGLDWLLLGPLLVELYVFILGVSLVLATLFAYLRDIGAIWEIVLRVFFYASGIIFPLELFPAWAEHVLAVNPFTQTMQDIRAIVLGGEITTSRDILGNALGVLLPLTLAGLVFAVGLAFFRRAEPWFAERV